MSKKVKPKSSSLRMKEAGFMPVQLWLTPEQHKAIFEAARHDGRKATQFVTFHAVLAAKNILKKS